MDLTNTGYLIYHVNYLRKDEPNDLMHLMLFATWQKLQSILISCKLSLKPFGDRLFHSNNTFNLDVNYGWLIYYF